LKHLHNLSALEPPEEGTPDYEQLKAGLEELIRLVEAVKMVDTENVVAFGRDDPGRQATEIHPAPELQGGRSLLKHADRTRNGFYIVDADKPQ
jgi:Asp-tRNA(Asn)/Glu-tRNA(Gln) amidotransferase C subunit